jgi:hypothetical protein
VPRSAFLEGAREAGGTKTCTGAIAKQKTAVPQGAASLSLAVLESDGRKREGSSEEQRGLWVVRRRGEKLGTERRFGLSHDWRSIRRRVRTRGNLRLACRNSVATQNRRERRASWLTDAARRYHSENARLFFDGADRPGRR